MNTSSELVAIWIKRMKLGPMDPVPSAQLVTASGIVGNANRDGRRQVTIIEEEVWAVMMEELNAQLPPSTRRANLMVRNFPLAESRGRVMEIGMCRIRILGETRPCERMDEALPGLRKAMSLPWRGGAFGEVLDDREIGVGDAVRWLE